VNIYRRVTVVLVFVAVVVFSYPLYVWVCDAGAVLHAIAVDMQP
jgi:hypothetical protein